MKKFNVLADFKNLVEGNKVMIFTGSRFCRSCRAAKKTFDKFGTKYQSLNPYKRVREGKMLMNAVSAVTGKRAVPAIYICGQHIRGSLEHLANSGRLTKILKQCCEGDVTCAKFASFPLHGH